MTLPSPEAGLPTYLAQMNRGSWTIYGLALIPYIAVFKNKYDQFMEYKDIALYKIHGFFVNGFNTFYPHVKECFVSAASYF